MTTNQRIEELERQSLKSEIPEFCIGDTVRVQTKIIEGEKERLQAFQGTVIARKGGGLSETFSVYRISFGEGMERVFALHSPRIVSITRISRGKIRRAKLYYLRGRKGKAAKVKEKIVSSKKKKAPQKTQAAESST